MPRLAVMGCCGLRFSPIVIYSFRWFLWLSLCWWLARRVWSHDLLSSFPLFPGLLKRLIELICSAVGSSSTLYQSSYKELLTAEFFPADFPR